MKFAAVLLLHLAGFALWAQTCSLSVIHRYEPPPNRGFETSSPNSIAIGADGSIYYAEFENNIIRRIDAGGTVSTVAGTGRFGSSPDGTAALAADLAGPRSVALDGSGRLLFVQRGAERSIRRFPLSGSVSTLAGPNGLNGFLGSGPLAVSRISATNAQAIAAGTDGRFGFHIERIAGNPNYVIAVDRDLQAEVLGTLTSDNLTSGNVAFGPDGALYSAVNLRSPSIPVRKYDFASKTFTSVAALSGKVSGFIYALAVGADGSLYVAEDSGVIQRVMPDGEVQALRSAQAEPRIVARGMGVLPDGDLVLFDWGQRTLFRLTTGCASGQPPSITAVRDGALPTEEGSRFAPGNIVTIFGERLGPATGIAAQADEAGMLPRSISGTSVTVDGKTIPLLYAGAKQVNAILPFGLQPGTTANLTVTTAFGVSTSIPFQVAESKPTIFNYGGLGDVAVALNQDGSVNSESNPAQFGTVVTFFATGIGLMTPTPEDGRIVQTAGGKPALNVSAISESFPGANLELLYSGNVPGSAPGVVQFNMRLPVPARVPTGTFRFAVRSGEARSIRVAIYAAL